MKNFKAIVSLVLALVMCLSCTAFAEEEAAPVYYQEGDVLPDFTVTTFDGQTFTLSEVLKEKEMVLINLWATWCGPCMNEFPYMQEAYAQYSDKIAVLALSVEEGDTPDVLTKFAADNGITFMVGSDDPAQGGPNLFSQMLVDGEPANGIPTSLVVDRFGKICFLESGSLPSVGAFTRLFDVFLGDGYTESVILDAIPPAKPTVAPSAEADINAALNVEGGALAFTNPTDEYTWPMTVAQDGDRTVVTNSNAGQDETTAAVYATVTVNAGDVLAYDFKVSSEAACDMVTLFVNDEAVKVFGGEKDWMTYGYEFTEAGTYNVALAYVKDMMAAGGADTCYIDNVKVVSGDEAAAVLAANPQYPAGGMMTEIEVLNGKQMFYQESQLGVLAMNFGMMTYYVVDGTEVQLKATLADGVDPEGAFFYSGFDGSQPGMTDCMAGDAYAVTMTIDSTPTSGYFYTPIYVYEDSTGMNVTGVMLFASEEDANAFMDYVNQYGLGITGWMYADGTAPSTDARPGQAAATESTYTVKYVDQDGNAVAGVMLQVCDAETCQVMTSDENGVVTFTTVPYAWELHTLKVPEGYTGDTETKTVTPEEGGEWTFVLTKN